MLNMACLNVKWDVTSATDHSQSKGSDMHRIGKGKVDLSGESTSRILKTAKTLIRTDFGGKNALEQIKKKALEKNLELGPQTCAFIKGLCENQVSGCRIRTSAHLDEVINRLSKTEQLVGKTITKTKMLLGEIDLIEEKSP
jgi:hypothetical protein